MVRVSDRPWSEIDKPGDYEDAIDYCEACLINQNEFQALIGTVQTTDDQPGRDTALRFKPS